MSGIYEKLGEIQWLRTVRAERLDQAVEVKAKAEAKKKGQ